MPLIAAAGMPYFFVIRINCGATSPYVDGNQQEWIPDTTPGIPNVYSVTGDGEAVSMTSNDLWQEQPHMENVGVEGVGLYVVGMKSTCRALVCIMWTCSLPKPFILLKISAS
jgi:hypothetical protein